MLKMGLPVGAVKNALQRDGKDPSVIDLDPEKSLKAQSKVDDGPPLKDDPEYSKVQLRRFDHPIEILCYISALHTTNGVLCLHSS